jgi:hypothetical protein
MIRSKALHRPMVLSRQRSDCGGLAGSDGNQQAPSGITVSFRALNAPMLWAGGGRDVLPHSVSCHAWVTPGSSRTVLTSLPNSAFGRTQGGAEENARKGRKKATHATELYNRRTATLAAPLMCSGRCAEETAPWRRGRGASPLNSWGLPAAHMWQQPWRAFQQHPGPTPRPHARQVICLPGFLVQLHMHWHV